MEGVAIGLVSEVDAKLGRVKVRFPWMNPPQASYWAPIAAALSGKSRGMRFMPEVDDEALVAFDRGEFDHPYVVGFLWNGADEAPDGVKTNRVVVTPGGHELRFEDGVGEQRVVLKTKGGQSLTMDDIKRSVVVHASGNRITLGPEGVTVDVVVGTLNVRSTAVTNVQALGMVNVTSAAAVSIQSTGTVNVTTPLLSVVAPMATFSGVVQANTVVATSVVSSAYSPGFGNLI